MREKRLFLVLLLVASLFIHAACSGSGSIDVTIDGGSTDSTGGTTGPIQITVDFNLNIDVDEGKDANGFTWENNFSEITITGYIGASNELTVPKTINGKPVTQIAKGAMKGFTGLKSIVIPGSVKTIEGVFEDCTGLETVTIEETGLENMKNAFKNCTSLKTVNVPATVREMQGAFNGCAALDCSITIPEGVTSLKDTFRDCAALQSITIPESVTSLSNAFMGCKSLKSIRVPAGVTSLYFAFSGCSALTNVEILAQVTTLENTFSGCTSLETVALPETVADLFSTFTDCTALKSIVLPSTVVDLENTFRNCASLQEIVIPAGVQYMNGAFTNCVALTSVTFEDLSSMVYGTYGAFDGCISLKKLDLPQECSFGGYGCIALEELTIRISEGYYWANDIAFANLPSLKKVTILSDAEELQIDTEYTLEDSFTLFTDDSPSWYGSLLSEARRALTNKHGYRYYSGELDDGTSCRRLVGIYDSSAWSAEPIPVEVKESRAQVGHQIIYTLYSPALLGDDLTPCVVLYKSVETRFLRCVRPDASDEICGSEYYADCEYSEFVEINGISYPLEIFVNTDYED